MPPGFGVWLCRFSEVAGEAPMRVNCYQASVRHSVAAAPQVISLLFCLFVAFVWIRSYSISDGFVWAHHGNMSTARSAWGRLSVLTVYGEAKPEVYRFVYVRWLHVYDFGTPAWAAGAVSLDGGERERGLLGFATGSATQEFPLRTMNGQINLLSLPSFVVRVPYWPMLALCAWPVWVRVPRMSRACWARIRKPKREGHCAHCGYDLRATSDRCPECGLSPRGDN